VNKQELLRQLFDNNLYYQNKVYRTPYIMPMSNNDYYKDTRTKSDLSPNFHDSNNNDLNSVCQPQ